MATGHIRTATTKLKRREEWPQFMDQILAEAPAGGKSMRFLAITARTKNATTGWRAIPLCHLAGHFQVGELIKQNGRISMKSARRFYTVVFQRMLRLPQDVILLHARRRRVGVVIAARTGRTFSRPTHHRPVRDWHGDIVCRQHREAQSAGIGEREG